MRAVTFADGVRASVHEAASAKGFESDVVDGALAAVASDIARVYDELILRPPDHPERRTYQRRVEALGLIEAVCESRGTDRVVVLRIRIEAFC